MLKMLFNRLESFENKNLLNLQMKEMNSMGISNYLWLFNPLARSSVCAVNILKRLKIRMYLVCNPTKPLLIPLAQE